MRRFDMHNESDFNSATFLCCLLLCWMLSGCLDSTVRSLMLKLLRRSIFKCEWMRNGKFTYTLNTTTSNRRHIIINAEWKKTVVVPRYLSNLNRTEYEKKTNFYRVQRGKNKMVEYCFCYSTYISMLCTLHTNPLPTKHTTHPTWNEHNMTCTKKMSNNNNFLNNIWSSKKIFYAKT